jgi:hypothetical protein
MTIQLTTASPRPGGGLSSPGAAPKRLNANSRSLQWLMLHRSEPNQSYHEKSLCGRRIG